MEADLQRFYQVDLADMYRGRVSPRKIAVFAVNLPRGSAVGQHMGGASAVTDEVDALWSVEHALFLVAHAQGGGKGKEPARREYPPAAHEQQAKEQKALSRAERFMQRHNTTT